MKTEGASASASVGNQLRWAVDLDRCLLEALGPIRETELEIRWQPRGRADESTQIFMLGQLAAWVTFLAPGEWAVVALGSKANARWAQVMRLDDACIVEVHDGSASDWASRVLPVQAAPERVADAEGAWDEHASAAIVWAWMHGGLPEGCHRTRLVRRRAGTAGDITWCTAQLP